MPLSRRKDISGGVAVMFRKAVVEAKFLNLSCKVHSNDRFDVLGGGISDFGSKDLKSY
jgi:hypothetical protein